MSGSPSRLGRVGMSRRAEGALYRPAATKAGTQGGTVYVESLSPLRQAMRFAPECDQPVRAGIPGLFLLGRPSAVLRLIVSVIINAVNAMLGRRPRAHVGEERLERISPALADADTAMAVPLVRRVVGVITAAFHPCPRAVLWTRPATRRMTVAGAHVSVEASTTAAHACLEALVEDKSLGAAGTAAEPLRTVAVRHAGISEHCPPSKLFIRKVFDFKMVCDRMGFSHDSSPFRRVAVRAARRTCVGRLALS